MLSLSGSNTTVSLHGLAFTAAVLSSEETGNNLTPNLLKKWEKKTLLILSNSLEWLNAEAATPTLSTTLLLLSWYIDTETTKEGPCSGAKIPTSLLSTGLTSVRCQFRIYSSLQTRAAFVSSYAFTPVLSSRPGGSAQCCCSTCPPDHLLHSSSSLASAPPLGFCLHFLPSPLSTAFMVAGVVTNSRCEETSLVKAGLKLLGL